MSIKMKDSDGRSKGAAAPSSAAAAERGVFKKRTGLIKNLCKRTSVCFKHGLCGVNNLFLHSGEVWKKGRGWAKSQPCVFEILGYSKMCGLKKGTFLNRTI